MGGIFKKSPENIRKHYFNIHSMERRELRLQMLFIILWSSCSLWNRINKQDDIPIIHLYIWKCSWSKFNHLLTCVVSHHLTNNTCVSAITIDIYVVQPWYVTCYWHHILTRATQMSLHWLKQLGSITTMSRMKYSQIY